MNQNRGGNRETKSTRLAVLGGMIVKGVRAWWRSSSGTASVRQGPARTHRAEPTRGNDTLTEAVRSRADGAHVEGGGRVVRLLPDDNDGARHQRILVKIAGGGTVLIAHNIDVAPRLAVRVGDEFAFKGVYVWNDRGGVIHWTHHDPAGFHSNGWVRANGVVSE